MRNVVVIWIWLCAYLNCAGWFLSAIRQLNAIGYAVALVIGIAAYCIWNASSNKTQAKPVPTLRTHRELYRLIRSPCPFALLVLAVMAFLGRLLHAPNIYDALAYRLPRVLHWLAADQWQWIHTIFPRLNNRACGIEWLSAP